MSLARCASCSCVYCLVSPADDAQCGSCRASLEPGTAKPAASVGGKRRRSSSVAPDDAECPSEPSMGSGHGAWDFPMSRDEKVRRLLLLLEAENSASAAAASVAEERRCQVAARTEELEAEVFALRSRVGELEGQAQKRMRQSRGASSSEDEGSSADEDDFQQHGLPGRLGRDSLPTSDEEVAYGCGDGFRYGLLQVETEDEESESDGPPPMAFGLDWQEEDAGKGSGSDNLLAQLLLSAPSLPMLPRGSEGEGGAAALPQHLSSMVTPRCPPAASASATRNLGIPRAPLGVGCLNLGGLQACTPRAGPQGRGTPRAPLGVGCLNLDRLGACTPRAGTRADTSRPAERGSSGPSWHDRPLCSHRLRTHLDAGVVTPRVVPLGNLVSSPGIVSAVRWRGVEAVEWLEFALEGAEGQQASSCDCTPLGAQEPSEHGQVVSASNQVPDVGGEFKLQKGESIQVLRGCAEARDGRMADWVVIVTSKLRSKRFGKLGDAVQANPTFSFIARPGFEICGVTTDADGSIDGVSQRAL